VKTQRALAVFLTVLLFALVIFGLGALFAVFHHRVWGYVAGVVTCAVMTYAGINSLRGDGVAPGPTGPNRPVGGRGTRDSHSKAAKGAGAKSSGGGTGRGRSRSR
jgi:hypothetical protein